MPKMNLRLPNALTFLSRRATSALPQSVPQRQPTPPLPHLRGLPIPSLQAHIDRLSQRMRIAVIYSGSSQSQGAVLRSTTNPRGWKSYESVANDIAHSLSRLGFRHVSVIPEDMQLSARLRDHRIDLAWLNTGGVQGFGCVGHAASMLEMLGVPYVGHDPINSLVLDNKHMFKQQLIHSRIPTSPFLHYGSDSNALPPTRTAQFASVFRDYDGPFVVKPVSGRASNNVSFVDDVRELDEVVMCGCESTGNLMMIEAFLPGREFCVAVSGPIVARQKTLTDLGHPFVFSAVERVLDKDEHIFTSMDRRRITSDRVRLLRADADRHVMEQLNGLARGVRAAFNLKSIVRLDVRADAAGNLFVLEANPKPDLTRANGSHTSIICSALAQSGMDYDDLIFSLVADRLNFLFHNQKPVVEHLM